MIQIRDFYGLLVPSSFSSTILETPICTHYWIIDPLVQGLSEDDYQITDHVSLKLAHVTDDQFGDEYEEAFIPLLNRGRKKEIGTRYGYNGTLTAQLRGRSS